MKMSFFTTCIQVFTGHMNEIPNSWKGESTQVSKNQWVNKTWNAHIIDGNLFTKRMKHLYILQHELTMNTVYMEDDNHKTTRVT